MMKALKILLVVFCVLLAFGTCFGILAHRNIHTVTFMISDFYYLHTNSGEKLYSDPVSVFTREHATEKSNIWGYIDQPEDRPSVMLTTFAGWYKDPECTIPFDFSRDTIHSDIVLYAKQIKTNYTASPLKD